MTRKEVRTREGRKRTRGIQCCCCSIFSWEKAKFEKFHELYFAGTLRDTDYEQYRLVTSPCDGGVQCLSCGNFVCHDCVIALHSAIGMDHPNLQDPWVQATRNSSPHKILEIPVGHCCVLKHCEPNPETAQDTMPVPSVDAVLAGANHYYQYDVAIGSTPPNCVDVFSLGASGSNAAVTHAVFPVNVALDIAKENQSYSIYKRSF